MRALKECLKHYLYDDGEEVVRGVTQFAFVKGCGNDQETHIALERYRSLISQGAFFKVLGRVNWRVVPRAPRVSSEFLKDLERIGEIVDRFLSAVDRFLLTSEYVKKFVGFPACPEEEVLRLLELGNPLQMLRLDLVMEKGSIPRLVEVQVVMGGLGITQALRVAYGRHSKLPGIAHCYEEVLEQAREKIGNTRVVAILGSKHSPYRHEHLCLARHLENWDAIVAPSSFIVETKNCGVRVGDKEVRLIHRLFRSPGSFNTLWGRKVLDALKSRKVLLLNPWKDFLEDKRLLALIHDPNAESFLLRVLPKEDLDALRELVPETRLLTPRLASELMSLPKESRDIYLKKGRSRESKGLFHGRQMSSKKWDLVCRSAAKEGDWILQKGVRAAPWEWNYLDQVSGTMRKIKGYVRMCPYFFRSKDGRLRLADVLITAREQGSRVHGASDAILTIIGAGDPG